MNFKRSVFLNWNAFPLELLVKELPTECHAHFIFLKEHAGTSDNHCYMFRTEYENLFYYTTSAFTNWNSNNEVNLSLVLYDEEEKKIYYRHQGTHDSNRWMAMEGYCDEWQEHIDILMLESKIDLMLRETT